MDASLVIALLSSAQHICARSVLLSLIKRSQHYLQRSVVIQQLLSTWWRRCTSTRRSALSTASAMSSPSPSLELIVSSGPFLQSPGIGKAFSLLSEIHASSHQCCSLNLLGGERLLKLARQSHHHHSEGKNDRRYAPTKENMVGPYLCINRINQHQPTPAIIYRGTKRLIPPQKIDGKSCQFFYFP